MKIQWHVPDSMRYGDEKPEEEEMTWETLKNHVRVKAWAAHRGFFRFSHDPYPPRSFPVPFPTTLIAEFKEGHEWWVVCHMGEIPPDLPEWKHPGHR